MKWILPALALLVGIVLQLPIYAADAAPALNHVGPVAAPYGVPEGSLFGGTPGPVQVYICTLESHKRETNDKFEETGMAHLKVVRSLTSSKRKTLTLSYWVVKQVSSRFSMDAQAAWPNLDKLPKGALLLCSVDESGLDAAGTEVSHGMDGLAKDVAPLSGPDDPFIAQVQVIIKLRDTRSINDLKRQCRQILDSGAGLIAMQSAMYVAFYRIAPKDPEAAFQLILLRLRSPENISGWELHWELTFIGKYLDKPAKPVHNWQELTNCIEPLLTAPFDPNEDPQFWIPCEPAVLHLLARVVHPKDEKPPALRPLRAAAVNGILDAIRRGKPDPYEPYLHAKTPQIQADIETIQNWLDHMPGSPTTRP